jgi:hypothetical protein
MARGAIAKTAVQNTIAEMFGNDYIGEFDKKIYVWANDGGEKVQIAISLTCPKNPIVVDKTAMVDDGDWDFSDTPKATTLAVAPTGPAEITEDEKNNIAALMERLGL